MILLQLRTATAEHHRRAEAAMPALDELALASAYAWSLRALHGFFRAWEPPVFAVLAPFTAMLSLAERHKLPLLARDLDALQIAAAPVTCAPPPDEALTVSGALGAMYVLEGSTLGGQMIERHCAAALDVSPSHGGTFYHGYGRETRARWSAFGSFMEAHVSQYGGDAEIIAGARACFDALAAWLARQDVFHRSSDTEMQVG